MCVGYVDPHPAIVTIRNNKDYARVLLYSYLPLLQGGEFVLMHRSMLRT